MSKIKFLVKRIVKPIIDNLHVRLNPKEYRAGNYYCPVCDNSIRYFNRLPDSTLELLYKHQCIHPLACIETFNMLQYTCPTCGVTDRDRLYALYLKKYLSGLTNKPVHFLDIAPRKGLTKFIQSFTNVVYRSADLYMEGVDDHIDITDMNVYANDRFDFIICSHVLEHVTEDVKAMNEFYRVLRPGGRAIMMVPILLTLAHDYENPSYISTEDRWKHFSQGDHVRMYSKSGFVEKLSRAGFRIEQLGKEYFGVDIFAKCGITESSVLYVVTKD